MGSPALTPRALFPPAGGARGAGSRAEERAAGGGAGRTSLMLSGWALHVQRLILHAPRTDNII